MCIYIENVYIELCMYTLIIRKCMNDRGKSVVRVGAGGGATRPLYEEQSKHMAIAHWLIMLFVCLSGQHLRSYQDGYRLVIVHTHGDFIYCWPTGRPGHQHHDPIPHSVTLS